MKFETLNLIRFGLYTDYVIDFRNKNAAGFHLLYGPNEAGKSTTLRAINNLLYGFPKITPDDYLHNQKDLRVGALIHGNGGNIFEVVRRKGIKNTLLNPAEEPIDEAVLAVELHGLNQDVFKNMFGLDHSGLVEGGNNLLAGKGETGESLFGAGTGIRNIHELRTSMKAEAETIFTPSASKKSLNAEFRKFKEAKLKIKRTALKPKEFLDHQKKLEVGEAQLQEKEELKKDLNVQVIQKTRLVRAAPLVAKRTSLLGQRDTLGTVPKVPDNCTEMREDAQKIIDTADSKLDILSQSLATKEGEFNKIHVPDDLISRSDEVDEFQSRLAVNRQAMNDLPKREAEYKSSQQEAQNFLRDLRKNDLSEIENMRLDISVTEPIKILSRKFYMLETAIDGAKKNVRTAEKALTDLKKETDLGSGMDPARVSKLVAQIRKKGESEEALKGKELQQQSLIDSAAKLISPLRSEVAAEFSPPLEETGRKYDDKFTEFSKQKDPLLLKKEELETNIFDAETNLQKIASAERFFTESDLVETRERRDQIWLNLKTLWETGQTLSAGDVLNVIDEFEETTQKVDSVADGLRENADLVARYAQLTLEKKRDIEALETVKEKITAIDQTRAELEAEWLSILAPLGLEYNPKEYIGWLSKYEKFASTMADVQTLQRENESLRLEIKQYKEELLVALHELEASAIPETDRLSFLLDYAEEFVAQIIEQNSSSKQLKKDRERAKKEIVTRTAELKEHTDDMKHWQTKWAAAIKPLNITGDSSVEVVAATLDIIKKIFEKIDNSEKTKIRIQEITDYASRLRAQIKDFAQDCAPDCIVPDFTDTAVKLIAKRNKGKESEKTKHGLEKEIKALEKDISTLRTDQDSGNRTIARLLKESDCKTVEEMIELENKSAQYHDICSKLEEVEGLLLAEGISIEELVRQLDEADQDSLPVEIDSLNNQIDELESELNQLRESIGGLRSQKEQMGGTREAADAAFEAQEALAMIKHHVDNYALLRLASFVLEEEIEQFRQKNQGPIMTRAKELFSRITCGAYSDLTSRFASNNDQLVLVCVKEDNSTVTVEDLSDGARDQLFLALRLAGIERHIENNAPLPLIIDDVLINFDDDRARATLEILGEVSKITQVLFFTHHARLNELAKTVVPTDGMTEHILGD